MKIARQQSALAIKRFKSALFVVFWKINFCICCTSHERSGVESLVADKVFPIARSYAQLKGISAAI